ncbi:hypothetical protein AMJ40_06965 [candidate division TA06 bacterium DG_26]|uniref:Uncharacterized protein n=1 Tax=candidate division TA06 bacterium DG_26 TaxID=1703771 RepID=A0A0S7WF33_UNCT6|nr:MAG: hypothetical protein AMJ40_06965 [candidate division TA06 bacterium DG_26]
MALMIGATLVVFGSSRAKGPTDRQSEVWISNPHIVCVSNYFCITLPPPDFSRTFLRVSGEIGEDVARITVFGRGQTRTFEREEFLSGHARINLPCDENGMPVGDPTGEYVFSVTDGSGHYDIEIATVERCLDMVGIWIGESTPAESTLIITWTPVEVLYGSEPDSVYYEVEMYQLTRAPMDAPLKIWELGEATHCRVETLPLSSLSLRRHSNTPISGWKYLVRVKARDQVGNSSYGARGFSVD